MSHPHLKPWDSISGYGSGSGECLRRRILYLGLGEVKASEASSHGTRLEIQEAPWCDRDGGCGSFIGVQHFVWILGRWILLGVHSSLS